MPIASTNPNSDRLLSENPKAAITKNVPIRETGIATSGMMAARQLCKNRMMTMTTRASASQSVLMTSSMERWMKAVGL